MRGAIGTACAALLIALGLASVEAAGGQSAEIFFPSDGVHSVLVSPEGRWIAATVGRGDEVGVLVQEVGTGRVRSLFAAEWIGQVAWEGPDSLIVESVTAAGSRIFLVARAKVVEEAIEFDVQKIEALGWLVDPLPMIPDELLWEIEYDGWTSLHRLSVADLVDFRERVRHALRSLDLAEKIATVKGRTITSGWLIDRAGNPRAALRREENGFTLLMPARGDRGPLEPVHRWDDEDVDRAARPAALSADGQHVVVLGYAGGNTQGLFLFDPTKKALGRPVFVDKDFDVDGVLRDELTGDLIAATYEENGARRFHYFPEYRARFLSKLPEEWRRDSIAILNGTVDRRVFSFLDSGATNPGDFYFRDSGGRIQKVGRVGENVVREALRPVESFRVESRDGTEVEAFLALPRPGDRPAPLIVMPHGGPKGVRDSRYYDPLVQYLMDWGFAVLQVNYRGSSGYGREFEELGKKEWARGIEDDIDAAVEHVLALPAVDAEKVCIVGASYGGFSALASVVRHRDRYRCAISIAGVTDIPFLGESADFSDSKQVLAEFEKTVGDLETERDKLIAVSPAYQVERIGVPILIVQGTKDRRVDPDHAQRMLLMLELFGKEHESLEIEGAGHGFDRDEWIIVARSIRRFVTRHLVPDAEFRPDPDL